MMQASIAPIGRTMIIAAMNTRAGSDHFRDLAKMKEGKTENV